MTIIEFTDTSGNVVAKYTYDSWGKLISIKDANDVDKTTDENFIGYINPLRYRGYYYDSETGLYYLNARYYDPEVSRFISADETLDGGYNLFEYCHNNPVNYCDFNGKYISSQFFCDLINSNFYCQFINYCFNNHIEGGFAIYSKNGQYNIDHCTYSKTVDNWDGPSLEAIEQKRMSGFNLEGIFHVHPFDPNLNMIYDGFSPKDVTAANGYKVPIFVYTEAGELLGYDPNTDHREQIIGLPYIDKSLLYYLNLTYGPITNVNDFRKKEAMFRNRYNGLLRMSPYTYKPETWRHFTF